MILQALTRYTQSPIHEHLCNCAFVGGFIGMLMTDPMKDKIDGKEDRSMLQNICTGAVIGYTYPVMLPVFGFRHIYKLLRN
jgi:hypothetical protein